MDNETGFRRWLLGQEIGFINFLRAVYDEQLDIPKPNHISITFDYNQQPISEEEIAELEQHLNSQGLKGIINGSHS